VPWLFHLGCATQQHTWGKVLPLFAWSEFECVVARPVDNARSCPSRTRRPGRREKSNGPLLQLCSKDSQDVMHQCRWQLPGPTEGCCCSARIFLPVSQCEGMVPDCQPRAEILAKPHVGCCEYGQRAHAPLCGICLEGCCMAVVRATDAPSQYGEPVALHFVSDSYGAPIYGMHLNSCCRNPRSSSKSKTVACISSRRV
jgi:hypothetical protein